MLHGKKEGGGGWVGGEEYERDLLLSTSQKSIMLENLKL